MSDNIVIEIAKIIEPGAFAVWYDSTAPDAEPCLSTIRQKYFRANAEVKATAILQRISHMKPEEIRAALVAHETEGWRKHGLPMDDPELKEVIERKYAIPRGYPLLP